MPALNFIIWNASPEIMTLPLPWLETNVTLRWYGLLFALGFFISQQILYYIYRKENKPEKDVDTLTIYMVVATLLGARLGHVLFYEPGRYLSNPIDILKVWEGGLASHGAAIAILAALWIYAKYSVRFSTKGMQKQEDKGQEGEGKERVRFGLFFNKRTRSGQSFLQVVDRIVIVVALTGALIRLGNFFNAEIIGKPTESAYGVVFANPVTKVLKSSPYVDYVGYAHGDYFYTTASNAQNVKIVIDFAKESGDYFKYNAIARDLRNYLSTHEHIDYSGDYTHKMVADESGNVSAIINTYMIPRHPTQLYESVSCVLLFLLLLSIWRRHGKDLPPGRLLGIFLIVCFTLRFLFEFLKENQVAFEDQLILNMGQVLSIPLVIAGIMILVRSYKNVTQSTTLQSATGE